MDPANQNGNGNGAGAGDGNGAGDQNLNNNNGNQPQGGQGQGQGSTPQGGANNNGGDQNGAGNGNGSGGVQLTDEQLAAAFQHPRFKALNDRAKKADELEQQAQKAAEEAAKKNGEFEKLYQTAEERATKAEQALKQERINLAVTAEAAKLGVVDAQAAIKLLDTSSITVSDDGTISGVAEAVQSLAQASPYLFKTPQQSSVGSGSNPAGGGNNAQAEFSYSQIQDLEFYKKNQAAIDKAVAEGRIDMSK